MNSEEKKQCFIKKMIEAWSILLEECEDIGKDEKGIEEVEKVDIDTVRQMLLVKAQAGKSEEIRDILKSFHVEKLSDLEVRYYGELLQMVKKI